MKAAVILALILLSLNSAGAKDTPVKFQLPNSQVSVLAQFYSSLIEMKVSVAPGAERRITVRTEGPIPRADAVKLLEQKFSEAGLVLIRKDSEIIIAPR